MIKTDDWTTQDLIKYLISVQSMLKPTEIIRFRHTPAFLMEAAPEQNKDQISTPEKTPRFKVSDLCEPLDVFRSLGLPVISWRGEDDKHNWRSDSNEGTLNMV